MISLNLVPDSEKKDIKLLYFYLGVKNLVFIFLVGGFLMANALVFAKIIMINYLNESITLNIGETTQIKTSAKEIRDFQTQLGEMKKIQDQYLPWSKFFSSFDDLVNPGITLNSLSISKNGALDLSGTAADRDDLKELETRLQKSGWFENFTIPYEIFFARKDIKFELKLKADPAKIFRP